MKTIPACVVIGACLLLPVAFAEQSGAPAGQAESTLQKESEEPVSSVLKSPDGEAYFPPGRESYYTEYYRAANLPSLLSKREEKGKVRFRLAILPSFSKPIFLTYSRGAEGGEIEITRLGLLRNGADELEPGKVELTGKVLVGKRMTRILEADAIDPDIRKPLAHLTKEQRNLYGGCDGCTWILEVSTDTDYTMEDIWSPGMEKLISPEDLKKLNLPEVDTQWFRKFGESLLEITDMKVPECRIPDLNKED